MNAIKAWFKEKTDIWKMIEYWKPAEMQVLAGVLFVALFGLVYQDGIMGAVFLGSMYVHEWMHAYAFGVYGVISKVTLLFPLGAVAAPISKEENAESDRLPWFDIAWIMQAGPIGNVLLMVVGAFLVAFLPFDFGSKVILANVYLAWFNLLPFGNLDAGQVFKTIFESLDNFGDKLLTTLLTIAVGGILIILIVDLDPWQLLIKLVNNLSVVGFLVVTILGIIRKSVKDDPKNSSSPQAMTWQQAAIHILVYALTCIVTLYFTTHL